MFRRGCLCETRAARCNSGVRQDSLTHQAQKSRIRADEPTRNEQDVESRRIVKAAGLLALCLAAASSCKPRRAQDAGPPPGRTQPARPAIRAAHAQWLPAPLLAFPMEAPSPQPRPGFTAVSPIITPEGHGPEGPPALDPNVQVVRFQGPEGLTVEVLAPQSIPVPIGDGGGIATVGLAARSRLPPAAGQHHRASRCRALPRDRGRRPPAPAPRDRPGQVPDPDRLQR